MLLARGVIHGYTFRKTYAAQTPMPSFELLRLMFQIIEAMCLAVSPETPPSDIWKPKAPLQVSQKTKRAIQTCHLTPDDEKMKQTSLTFFGVLLDRLDIDSLDEYMKAIESVFEFCAQVTMIPMRTFLKKTLAGKVILSQYIELVKERLEASGCGTVSMEHIKMLAKQPVVQAFV